MKPAHGTYRYSLDGIRQAIEEPFKIVETGNEGNVLSGQRIVGGKIVLEVEAKYERNLCSSIRLAWMADTRRDLRYVLAGPELQWHEGEQETRIEPLPADCLLFPLLRAATGYLFPEMDNRVRNVVLPNLRQPNSEDFLTPLLSTRHVKREPGNEGHLRFYGGEYGDAGADYWVNKDNLVERYRWETPTGTWDVTLET